MKQTRKFEGIWIPVHLWENHELTITERCFLAEVNSLDNDKDRRCWASNKYFAVFFGVSEATIKRSIAKLKKLRLIDYKYSKTKEGLERNIWLIGVAQYDPTPQGQNGTGPRVNMTRPVGSKRPSNNKEENSKENSKDNGLFKKGLILPWDSKGFIDKWLMWKSYKKKEKAFHFKSLLSEQAALKKLAEISGGNEGDAISIIVQSIENGWSGLFKLKHNGEQKNDLFSKEAVKERMQRW